MSLLKELLHIGIVVDDLEIAGARVELVEYTGPIVERFGPVMARRDGIHHLCFRVDDLDAALADVRARGFSVVRGFPLEGAHGRIGFLEPEPGTGLIVELCQVAARGAAGGGPSL